MDIIGDFHTHTVFSDGKGTVELNARAAKERGLRFLAATDHGLSTLFCNQIPENLKKQTETAVSLSGDGFKVYSGIEANLTGFDGKIDIGEEEYGDLDVLLFGFHRFIKPARGGGNLEFLLINGFSSLKKRRGLREKNTEAYIKAIENYPVDVVCHLMHRAVVDVGKIADAARANGCYIELNEKHIETLEDGIDDILKSGANFILGSDAHKPSAVGKFPRVTEFVTRHNIPQDRIAGVGFEPKFKSKRSVK